MTRSSSISTELGHPLPDSINMPLQPTKNQQLGYMAALHPDIILTVFGYLTQDDCLRCMAVCRDWYDMVPQYSQSLWKKVCLSGQNAHKENQRQILCLGDHVKIVILDTFDDEQGLYRVMHKLFKWGCTQLISLEFRQCHTNDHDAFLDALTELAPHLTYLTILDHGSNIAFLPVFNACPELTHFTYQIQVEAWEASNVYDTEPLIHRSNELLPLDRATKITHLSLDVLMNNQARVYPILRRCPKLRYFVGPSKRAAIVDGDTLSNELQEYNQFQIDLDKLFDLCPEITSIKCYYTYFTFDTLGDMDTYATDSGSNGLHYLDICEDYGSDRIGLCVTRNQNTLEYLSLQPYDFFESDPNQQLEWSPVFQSLELPRLRTLVCYFIQSDADSLVALLNNCPALETLILHPARMRIDSSSIRSLGTLHQLRSLSLTYLQMAGPCFLMLLDCIPALEELTLDICSISIKSPMYRFNGLAKLKHLSLSYITWMDDNGTLDMDHAVAHFIRCLVMQSKLETVLLANIPGFEAKALLTVADIPSLKVCDVILAHVHCSMEVFCTFAAKLLDTAIEILRIRSHTSLAFGILERLGDLPFLKELYLSPVQNFGLPCEIDGLDFLGLLHKSKALTGVYFYNVAVMMSGRSINDQELSVLVEQEAPRYSVLNGTNQTPPQLKKVRAPLQYNVSIKHKVYP
ncbi:hypothetical protein BJV82DRAFT_628456 [Fennellomyces sp. T-0311]|nr:hypothetical protein BJV82DRAFT_628456 [Fennellomyces sp. T-0311]